MKLKKISVLLIYLLLMSELHGSMDQKLMFKAMINGKRSLIVI
ncbi:sorbose reductase SOU1 [Candida albicans P78048]|uniref:Sorbose reductase SOU1 n=1 Tax=Candida albicans P78048 TaxID=1094989 RepID=A0AB34PR55_CANAX|nr:sorbose reductase SOU1 [Candida albicans P78048]